MRCHMAVLSAALLISGCATVRPRESFVDVQRSLADRSPQRVHWLDGSAADRAAADEVDALLAQPLTADAAVQVALLNNRNLQATYEDLGVAQADLVGAGLLRNPVFDGSVRFAKGGGSPNLDFGVAFDFLDVFFLGLRKQMAAAQLEVAKVNVSSAVLGLAGETRVAFFQLQAAEQAVELRQQVERATAASVELATRLREAGNNLPLDLANERALHEESKLARAAAEADVLQRREALNRLMGAWGPRTEWKATARLPEPPTEALPDVDLERRAVERSLELQAARAQVNVAARELGVTRPLGYLSDLELGAIAERDDGEWEAGPSVALPLPIFSQGQPAVARARAELRRARQRHEATGVEVRSAVRAAHARTESLRQRLAHHRSVLLPLRGSIVEETQLQYNAMQIGAFQLLQAKRDEIEAGGTYLNLLREYWIARTQLELILSGRMPAALAAETPDASPTRSTSQGGH